MEQGKSVMQKRDRVQRYAGPHLSRRRLIAAGAGAGGAALLASCGQKSSSAKPSVSSGAPPKPVSGGALHVALMEDFFTFDPSIDAKIVNPNAQTLAYESLLQFKSGPGVDYYDTTLRPLLATSWETPDAQTFIFHLRKGVKFANIAPINGRPFVANDVKFSLEYQARTGEFKTAKIPPGDLSYMYEGMDSVTTPDDATANVHFAAPFAPFLNYASGVGSLIMPRDLMTAQGGFQTNIVGTGAYQLDTASIQHGTLWVFKKNPTYWDTGRPYLDSVNHIILRDDVSTQGAFQAHQIDIWRPQNPDLQVIATVRKTNPDAVAQDTTVQQLGLYISNARGPLADERVRRAVSLSIDRSEFSKTFAGGKTGLPIIGTLPGTFTQQEAAQVVKFDPAQAKQLLSAAGYANGVNLEAIMSGTSTANQAQLLQGQLKQTGINMKITTLDSAGWVSRLHGADFDFSINSFAVVGDVDSKLYGNFYSKSPGNYVKANDPEYDKLAVAQRQAVDPAKRRDAVKAAATYLEQHAISTTLYLQAGATMWRPAIKNYADHWEQYDWLAPQVWLQR